MNNMRKPLLAWLVQISLVCIALIYALSTLAALITGFAGIFIALPNIIACAIDAPVAFFGGLLFVRSVRQEARERAVVLFFWVVLFAVPIENVLGSLHLYPPHGPLTEQQLLGAAAFEIFRYVALLTLIVWLSFSKAAKAYLAANWRAPSLLIPDERPFG